MVLMFCITIQIYAEIKDFFYLNIENRNNIFGHSDISWKTNDLYGQKKREQNSKIEKFNTKNMVKTAKIRWYERKYI